ncbi:MAG: hypothetical protein JNK82_17600, partial [Myxococcaceae bacterium]|nr:hypothetical protein [Myxococcaceae bacterium]
AKIVSERARAEREANEREKALANALAPTPDAPSRSPDAPQPEQTEVDAGPSSDFRAGMTIEEMRRVSQGCFSSSGPLTLRNPDGSESQAEMFEKMDSTLCNQRYAKFGDRFLVFRDGKLAGEFPKSSLTQVTISRGDGGLVPMPQPGQPAPPQPQVAPAPVEPGGDKPPTPLPAPTSPGENTGPAPAP